MDVRVGLWRKLSAKELMLLNCGVGEDSGESLGLQRDPTSPSSRRSALGFLWKDWCWGWNSSTLATSCEESLEKTLMLGGIRGRRRMGTREDEMAGWYHWLNAHEFEWTPGVGDGQGGLACCVIHGVTESQTWMSDWTELNCTEPLKGCLFALESTHQAEFWDGAFGNFRSQGGSFLSPLGKQQTRTVLCVCVCVFFFFFHVSFLHLTSVEVLNITKLTWL